MANPRDKGIVVEKINNGNVKVNARLKGQRSKVNARSKKEQPAATTKLQTRTVREQLSFTTEQVIEATRSVGHPAISREISDKLGIADPDQGRAFVRSRMKQLIKDGKIKTGEPEEKSRATFLYSVAE